MLLGVKDVISFSMTEHLMKFNTHNTLILIFAFNF